MEQNVLDRLTVSFKREHFFLLIEASGAEIELKIWNSIKILSSNIWHAWAF